MGGAKSCKKIMRQKSIYRRLQTKHGSRNVLSGKRPYVTIPARFHRRPLPIPEFAWCGNWKKSFEKGKLPPKIEKWIKARLQANKQALIFLPNIKLMEKTAPLFQQLHPNIETVHAEDPNRKEKVERMRKKRNPCSTHNDDSGAWCHLSKH